MAELQDYQPVGRWGATAVRVRNHLYLWGGNQTKLVRSSEEKQIVGFTSHIDIFNLLTGKWEQRTTTGNPPLGVIGYAATAIGNEIYYFGGYSGDHYSNSLTSLNVDTLTWREVTLLKNLVAGGESYPSKKKDCGMISVTLEEETYLVVIGGCGPVLLAADEQSELQTPSSFSNNDVHLFHLTSGHWYSLEGHNRSPCYSLSLTSINKYSALMVGDSFLCKAKSVCFVTFTKTSADYVYLPLPSSRLPSYHSSVLIDCVPSEPHLLLMGIDCCWLLDIHRKQWCKLGLPPVVTHKRDYSLSVWNIASRTVWVIQCGGLDNCGQALLDDMVIIELSYASDNKWSCNSAFFLSQYQEKLKQIHDVPTRFSIEDFKADVAYNVICSNGCQIKEAQIDLCSLANKLMEKEVINDQEKRDILDELSHFTTNQRMDRLLNLVKASVKSDGNDFKLFLDILYQENTRRAKRLADKLFECYKNNYSS